VAEEEDSSGDLFYVCIHTHTCIQVDTASG